MQRNFILIVIFLIVLPVTLYTQERAISDAVNQQILKPTIEESLNKQISILVNLRKVNSMEKAINDQIKMVVYDKKVKNDIVVRSFYNSSSEDWRISSAYGLTHYNYSFKDDNYSSSFVLGLTKRVNRDISISSYFSVLNLEGKRDVNDAFNVYDPYELYEGNGDYFKTKITELSVVLSSDFPQRLISFFMSYLNEKHVFPQRFNLYYNIGIGVCNFNSIRYNYLTNSYIYSYGYNDLQLDFETRKPFLDLPRSTTLIYGPSVEYRFTKFFKIYLSSLMRYVDSPYIDSEKESGIRDKFRNMELGLIYLLNAPKKTIKN